MRRALPLLLMLTATCALAQKAGQIYTCVDATGKRFTSDRPIVECIGREQQVRNRDGSIARIVPPVLTADERAAAEAREREEAKRRATEREYVRRDRNLMQRYPDEAAHDRAREAALDPVRRSLRVSAQRLELLAKERTPLDSEAEFYVGRKMPAKLRQQLDANDAAVEAQHSLISTQQAELARVNSRFDIELERLRKLWSGAAPGSLGPLAEPPPPARAAASAASGPAVAAAASAAR